MSSPVFDALLGLFVKHSHPEIPAAVLLDTRANILAADAATVRLAVSTETVGDYDGHEVFLANGSAWLLLPFLLYPEPEATNMGIEQSSPRIGYGEHYISDKALSNVWLGGNSLEIAGALRHTEDGFEGHHDGAYRTFVVGFVFQEGEDGQLQMQPNGSTDWFDVFTGNSVRLGANGLPLTQQHNTHMGAYPAPQIMHGGNAAMENPAQNRRLLNRTIHRIVPRTMSNAERLGLSGYQVFEGEDVFCSDTKTKWWWDGSDWHQYPV